MSSVLDTVSQFQNSNAYDELLNTLSDEASWARTFENVYGNATITPYAPQDVEDLRMDLLEWLDGKGNALNRWTGGNGVELIRSSETSANNIDMQDVVSGVHQDDSGKIYIFWNDDKLADGHEGGLTDAEIFVNEIGRLAEHLLGFINTPGDETGFLEAVTGDEIFSENTLHDTADISYMGETVTVDTFRFVSSATVTVPESASEDDVIYQTVFENEAQGNLIYSLAETPNNLFEIDSTTGKVTLAAGQSLDYEDDSSHRIIIAVSDGINTQYQDVLIKVVNTEEGLFFNDGVSVTIDVDENTPDETPIYQVAATNNESTSLLYSVSDISNFEIDTQGRLYFRRDNTADFEMQDTYTVTIEAYNGGVSVQQTVTINIIDVEEVGDTLTEGEMLAWDGSSLRSASGDYHASFGNDGIVRLYESGVANAVWESDISFGYSEDYAAGGSLEIREGRVVIVSADGEVIAQSDSGAEVHNDAQNQPLPLHLFVTNKGELVLATFEDHDNDGLADDSEIVDTLWSSADGNFEFAGYNFSKGNLGSELDASPTASGIMARGNYLLSDNGLYMSGFSSNGHFTIWRLNQPNSVAAGIEVIYQTDASLSYNYGYMEIQSNGNFVMYDTWDGEKAVWGTDTGGIRASNFSAKLNDDGHLEILDMDNNSELLWSSAFGKVTNPAPPVTDISHLGDPSKYVGNALVADPETGSAVLANDQFLASANLRYKLFFDGDTLKLKRYHSSGHTEIYWEKHIRGAHDLQVRTNGEWVIRDIDGNVLWRTNVDGNQTSRDLETTMEAVLENTGHFTLFDLDTGNSLYSTSIHRHHKHKHSWQNKIDHYVKKGFHHVKDWTEDHVVKFEQSFAHAIADEAHKFLEDLVEITGDDILTALERVGEALEGVVLLTLEMLFPFMFDLLDLITYAKMMEEFIHFMHDADSLKKFASKFSEMMIDNGEELIEPFEEFLGINTATGTNSADTTPTNTNSANTQTLQPAAATNTNSANTQTMQSASTTNKSKKDAAPATEDQLNQWLSKNSGTNFEYQFQYQLGIADIVGGGSKYKFFNNRSIYDLVQARLLYTHDRTNVVDGKNYSEIRFRVREEVGTKAPLNINGQDVAGVNAYLTAGHTIIAPFSWDKGRPIGGDHNNFEARGVTYQTNLGLQIEGSMRFDKLLKALTPSGSRKSAPSDPIDSTFNPLDPGGILSSIVDGMSETATSAAVEAAETELTNLEVSTSENMANFLEKVSYDDLVEARNRAHAKAINEGRNGPTANSVYEELEILLQEKGKTSLMSAEDINAIEGYNGVISSVSEAENISEEAAHIAVQETMVMKLFRVLNNLFDVRKGGVEGGIGLGVANEFELSKLIDKGGASPAWIPAIFLTEALSYGVFGAAAVLYSIATLGTDVKTGQLAAFHAGADLTSFAFDSAWAEIIHQAEGHEYINQSISAYSWLAGLQDLTNLTNWVAKNGGEPINFDILNRQSSANKFNARFQLNNVIKSSHDRYATDA